MTEYRTILKISPRGLYFQRPFLRGLSKEGNLHFQIDRTSLKVGSTFIVFALFTLYLRAIFQVQAPGGLIFGGAI